MKRVIKEFANLGDTFYDSDNNYEWRVFVNDSDRDHDPHFHLQCIDLDVNKSIFETRILLSKPRYYDKSDKRISSELLNDLVELLERPHRNSKFKVNNWEYLCYIFSSGINNTKIDPDEIMMPNYRMLPTKD